MPRSFRSLVTFSRSIGFICYRSDHDDIIDGDKTRDLVTLGRLVAEFSVSLGTVLSSMPRVRPRVNPVNRSDNT